MLFVGRWSGWMVATLLPGFTCSLGLGSRSSLVQVWKRLVSVEIRFNSLLTFSIFSQDKDLTSTKCFKCLNITINSVIHPAQSCTVLHDYLVTDTFIKSGTDKGKNILKPSICCCKLALISKHNL